jgi:protein ImuB
VERILVTVEHTRVHPRQIAIQHGPKPRDLDAAARAIARLRASFGPEAVSYASLRETHLPEAAFCFVPARELRLPRPQTLGAELPLVRRVYTAPRTLPPLPRHEPEAWLGHHGAVTRLLGPHRIAGGWWSPRGARERDYYFAETKKSEVLWVYYDAKGRCWRLQGLVD